MKASHVINCSLPSWYPKFKKVTIPSKCIQLPQDFIDYLHQDGVVLPKRTLEDDNEESADTNDESNADFDDCDSPSCQEHCFPELDKDIGEIITNFGGSAFPKLNWSAPRDAAWITVNHSLQCWTPDDIYLLLKSSDFITHDLTQAFANCDAQEPTDTNFHLVLRKWLEINPGMEFRCFVRNNKIIGVSQRDATNFYGFILNQKPEIMKDITSFYNECIRGKFPDEDFVMDVYRVRKDKVILIDFNVFGKTTDGLLFDWDELTTSSFNEPEFRCITEAAGIQPNPYRYYAMPTDFLHLATGQDPLKLVDFLKMKIQTDGSASSDDEDVA